MLVDTHCHLYDEAFDSREQQIEDLALKNGLTRILLPNIDVNSLPKMDAVAAKYPALEIQKMIGLHPCYVKEDWSDQLDQIEAWYHQKPEEFCAVGEIGLDLYWDQSTLAIQIEASRRGQDKDGRLYSGTITATGQEGGATQASFSVKVEHDMGKGKDI